MKKNPKNGRALSEEEKKLWKFVTRGDEPLHTEKNEKVPGEKPKPVRHGEARKYKPAPLPVIKQDTKHKKIITPVLGQYANIDANTAERFRKGNYPIEATLDLHGMTSEKAHAALIRFIGSHHKRKSRCLLVITGKGKTGEGVLRRALPGWLADDALAAMILAFDNAKAKHGGSGAFYVLLRRKR